MPPKYRNIKMLNCIGTTHELKAGGMMEVETQRYPAATDIKGAYIEYRAKRPATHRFRALSLDRPFNSCLVSW